MHGTPKKLESQTNLAPQVLDALYDNRARVPEHPTHLKSWAEKSAQARASTKCVLNVPYGVGANDVLDIFLPDTDAATSASVTASENANAPAPIVVFLHGGYWRSLDKSDHSFVAPALCARGICVVVVNYDLCPGSTDRPVRIPGITVQVAQALQWLHLHMGSYGGDANRMVAVGHSAGGQLAAMMLLGQTSGQGAGASQPLVQQAVSISGVFDLEPLMLAPSFQASLHLDEQQVALASPARWAPPTRGKLRALVGAEESDEFLRQNRLIQQRWGTAAVPVEMALLGLNHFSILDTLADPASDLFAQVQQAVAACTCQAE